MIGLERELANQKRGIGRHLQGCISCPKSYICVAEGDPRLCRNYQEYYDNGAGI